MKYININQPLLIKKKSKQMITNQSSSTINNQNHKANIEQQTIHSYNENKQVNQQTQKNQSVKNIVKQQIQKILVIVFKIIEVKQQTKNDKKQQQPPKNYITDQAFLQQYQRKLQIKQKSSHPSHQGKQTIQKKFPFTLNTSQIIGATMTSRLYKCQLSDSIGESQILQKLLQAKTQLQEVGNNDGNRVADSTFDQVYYKALSNHIKNRNQTIQSPLSHLTSQLKCKIINLSDLTINQFGFLNDYLQKLNFFYEHRDNIYSKNLLISQKIRQQQQKLKLFSFMLSNIKVFLPESLYLIENYLQKNEPLDNEQKKLPQTKNDVNEQKIGGQYVILTIVNQIKNQNWEIRQMALDTLEKVLDRNFQVITVSHMKALKNITDDENKISKKYAYRLIMRCLIKLLQIENDYNSQAASSKQSAPTFLDKEKHDKMKYIACQALYNYKQFNHSFLAYRLSQKESNIQSVLSYQQQIQMSEFIQYCKPKLQALKQYPQKSQPLKSDNLMKIFSKTFLSKIRFSSSQNLQLNSKLFAYSHLVNKQKSRYKKHKTEKQIQKDFFCIISQYHPGKTLKEVILNNWKGLQEHNILMKLATKLFWMNVQLQYFQFDCHIATLQNVIIYDNIQHPDLNINLTSFINSAFLFQQNKQDQKQFIEKKKSSFEEFFPFFWSQQIEQKSNQYLNINRVMKLDPIKHFLSILLFMVCRRLDDFHGFSAMFKNLDQIVEKKKKIYNQLLGDLNKKQEKKKQILNNTNNPQTSRQTQLTLKQLNQKINDLNEQIIRLKPYYDEQSKYSFPNILKLIDPKSNKDQNSRKLTQKDFFQLTSFLPKLYSIFLEQYNKPANNAQQYEMQNYTNSNICRIREFQHHLGLREDKLFSIFFKNLAGVNNQQEERVTWKNIFSVLFAKGVQTNIAQSKLLSNLCQIFSYPLKQQDNAIWLPPQIYFALKFGIDFCYFQELYDGKWFNCFETTLQEEKLFYDMETMCLLKNIKSEVIKVTNLMVEKIIAKIEKNKKIFFKTEIQLDSKSDENQEICLKISSAINLLRYLRIYEKKIYSIQVKRSQSDKHVSFFTNDYFDTFLEEDIDELEEMLNLFVSRLKLI